MISLGVDPSLTGLGWCILNSGVIGPDRVVARGVFSTSAAQVFVCRNMYLREAVSQILTDYPSVQAVGVESPPYGEQFSEGLYGLFLFINEAIYRHRKDVVYFDPAQVKMLAKMDPAIRKGSMDKGDMVEAVRAETGIQRWDHNEADAYIIARSAAGFWDYHAGRITREDLTPAEYQSFAKVRLQGGKEHKDGAIFKEGRRFFQFSQVPLDQPLITPTRSSSHGRTKKASRRGQ